MTRCSAWDRPGIGYHTMFGSPGEWTPVAKSCPGAARIAQFAGILHAADTAPTDTIEGLNMTPDELATAIWSHPILRQWDGKTSPAERLLSSTQQYAIQGGFDGKTPDTAPSNAGTPTLASADHETLAALTALVQKIADKVGVVA